MQIRLTAPLHLRHKTILPASKSISNRALIIHALAGGKDLPRNVSDCDDTFVMVRALTQTDDPIDIMAAGTAMRFLTAFLAVGEGTHIITGTQRMQQRPISILVNALRALGADVEYAGNEGFPPLRIVGRKLVNSEVTLPGNVSSQYISALLMIGPALTNGLKLTLTGEIVSRPYIDLTLKLMRDFGANVAWISENQLEVKPQPYQAVPYYVESDWSAASYWYEICALSEQATVCLPGLFRESPQGDSEVARLFEQLGVETVYGEREVTLRKTGKITARMEYDFANQPAAQPVPKVVPIQAGDYVRIKGQTSVGQVMELNGKNAVVTFGLMKTNVKAERLERAEAPKQSLNTAKATFVSSETQERMYEKKLNFKQDIDVRGMRGDEAIQAVTYFIDDAILVGVSRVRILHGTGTGILRTLIRQYLATVPGVKHFQDEHVHFGGAGITVVDLK